MYQVAQTGTKLALPTKGLFNEVGAQNIRQLAQIGTKLGLPACCLLQVFADKVVAGVIQW